MATHIKEFCWFTLLGMPGFLFCGFGHTCMDGHMGHPPYAWWHIGVDLLWAALFVCAAFGAFRSRLQRRILLGSLLVTTSISRLLFGSLGGMMLIFFELPAGIYLSTVALRILRRGEAEIKEPENE